MRIVPVKVVLDANVLFPFSLRDTLLRAASKGLCSLYWSEEILDETTRSLVAKRIVTHEQAARLRAAMTGAFPESMVTGYKYLIDTMPNHDKDRHLAATAVQAGAHRIVTNNLKHFRVLPRGIEAQSADEFLCSLFALNPDYMLNLIRIQANALRNPPCSVGHVLYGLAKTVPNYTQRVAEQAKCLLM